MLSKTSGDLDPEHSIALSQYLVCEMKKKADKETRASESLLSTKASSKSSLQG
jgi:hypothetical protein